MMENGECVCVQLKRLSSWPHKGRNSEEDLVIEIQKNSQRLWARVEEWRCSSPGRGGGRGQGGEDDVEVQGGGRGQGVQLQVQDQLNLIINIQWIIVNWFLFWKIQFFLPVNEGRSGGGEGSKYKSKVEDRLKLTDNIFAYHTFIYIRQKAKVNLELRVKELAPPSPALSEFKKIFSHTRLKLPPLGFTSLTLSLEPALLLKFVIPFEICNSKTWFLPSESFSCWPPKESEVEILAWGVPPPLIFAVLLFWHMWGVRGGTPSLRYLQLFP